MTKLWSLHAHQISKILKKREVSATEICNSLINHIEEINPKIYSIVVKTYEDAKQQAKVLDKKIKASKMPSYEDLKAFHEISKEMEEK